MTFAEACEIIQGESQRQRDVWFMNSRMYHAFVVAHSPKNKAPEFADVYPFEMEGAKRRESVTMEEQNDMWEYWTQLTEKHPIKDGQQ